jgi:hypothetical protein
MGLPTARTSGRRTGPSMRSRPAPAPRRPAGAGCSPAAPAHPRGRSRRRLPAAGPCGVVVNARPPCACDLAPRDAPPTCTNVKYLSTSSCSAPTCAGSTRDRELARTHSVLHCWHRPPALAPRACFFSPSFSLKSASSGRWPTTMGLKTPCALRRVEAVAVAVAGCRARKPPAWVATSTHRTHPARRAPQPVSDGWTVARQHSCRAPLAGPQCSRGEGGGEAVETVKPTGYKKNSTKPCPLRPIG